MIKIETLDVDGNWNFVWINPDAIVSFNENQVNMVDDFSYPITPKTFKKLKRILTSENPRKQDSLEEEPTEEEERKFLEKLNEPLNPPKKQDKVPF